MGRIIHCSFQKKSTTRTSLGPVTFDALGNAEVSDKMAEKLLRVKGYTEVVAKGEIVAPTGIEGGTIDTNLTQEHGEPDDIPQTTDITAEEIKQRQISELGSKEVDELKQLATSLDIVLPPKIKKKEDIVRIIVDSGKFPQPSA